jgi:predicted esterase YcpF (UPF0227 family)
VGFYIVEWVNLEVDVRMKSRVERRARDKIGNAVAQTDRPRLRSYLNGVTLGGWYPEDLAAVCILTKSFRLKGNKLNQTMYQNIVSKEMFQWQAGKSCDELRFAA